MQCARPTPDRSFPETWAALAAEGGSESNLNALASSLWGPHQAHEQCFMFDASGLNNPNAPREQTWSSGRAQERPQCKTNRKSPIFANPSPPRPKKLRGAAKIVVAPQARVAARPSFETFQRPAPPQAFNSISLHNHHQLTQSAKPARPATLLPSPKTNPSSTEDNIMKPSPLTCVQRLRRSPAWPPFADPLAAPVENMSLVHGCPAPGPMASGLAGQSTRDPARRIGYNVTMVSDPP